MNRHTPAPPLTIVDAMAATGTDCPSAAIRALNAGRHGKYQRYVYKPHIGAKQRAKALREMGKPARVVSPADEPKAATPVSTI